MRFYGFGNYYLSSLQQGLQAAHVVAEIALSSRFKGGQWWHTFEQWAEFHKTIVLLNGGNSADLRDLFFFLDSKENPYPYEMFCEDQQSLDRAATCVGIILPEEIYNSAAAIRSGDIFPGVDSYIFSPDPSLDPDDELRRKERLEYLCKVLDNANPWTLEMINRLNRCGLAH